MSAAVDIARSVPIEAELEKRGHRLRRVGRDLVGPCPACGGIDRFSVTPAKRLWHCRRCDKGGDVIGLVQHLDGGDFLDAVQKLTGERPKRKLSGQEALAQIMARERQRHEEDEQAKRENETKTKYALRLWDEGSCVWDTPAQAYLASRRCGDMFPPDRDAVFRFHQRCAFGEEMHPCLLTLLRNIQTNEPQAVHRTALTPDGQKIDRKMKGPKVGAAVKLAAELCA